MVNGHVAASAEKKRSKSKIKSKSKKKNRENGEMGVCACVEQRNEVVLETFALCKCAQTIAETGADWYNGACSGGRPS